MLIALTFPDELAGKPPEGATVNEADPFAPSFKLNDRPDKVDLDFMSKIVFVDPNPTLQSEREQNKYSAVSIE